MDAKKRLVLLLKDIQVTKVSLSDALTAHACTESKRLKTNTHNRKQ